MYLLYEESGSFKAGTIITDNDSSLQVDTQHGKRVKVKAVTVMMRFNAPPPAEFMDAAHVVRDEADTDFLWEVAGSEEFGFTDLAREYFGHEPTPAEAGGILMRLHEAPMYFYKKGRGRYKSAPPEALAAAKAGVERKQREAELLARYVAQLGAYELPEEFATHLDMLLYAPDKNQLEWKALDEACKATSLTPVKLLDRCGAIPSSHDYHVGAFLREHFPRGTGFGDAHELPDPPRLPDAGVQAFSMDDAATTEIDDAFSVTRLDNGNWRVGIHIAVPALGIVPSSPLDDIAARRLSTVYYPGGKITMLPDSAIHHYTLGETHTCPALSMYVEVGDGEWKVLNQETRLEQVHIAANLRHETLEAHFHTGSIANDSVDYPFKTELDMLWLFSGALEAARGKTPDPNLPPRADYNFKVENDRVSITDRLRGNPIDRVVSELMIYVNSEWGRWLAETDTMALYRTQQSGKVKMSTKPGPHVGLGVAQYTWASSPLRRYVDLVNQRQIMALAQGVEPPYAAKSEVLYTAMRDFEVAYDAYNDFQRNMERYWCLRWLVQEGIAEINAGVIKENLVRLDGIPFVTRVHSLPELPPGSRVSLKVDGVDLFDVELLCSFQRRLDIAPAATEPVAQ
ncbi:MAG: ribonuclease catalytic domain-containing protein [Sulfuriferula sp.]